MKWSAISQAVKDVLDTVPGIGKVQRTHKHHNKGLADPDFASKFFVNKYGEDCYLSVARITRRGKSSENCQESDTDKIETHSVEVQFYSSLLDSQDTELDFQDLLDDALETFSANRSLSGTVNSISLPVFTNIGHSSFYGVLCHSATMNFDIEVIS